MRTVHVHTFLVLMSVLQLACTLPPKDCLSLDSSEPAKTIYLVRHGWHAGIVVKRADVPPGTWPQHNEFPGAEYLEVGWASDPPFEKIHNIFYG